MVVRLYYFRINRYGKRDPASSDLITPNLTNSSSSSSLCLTVKFYGLSQFVNQYSFFFRSSLPPAKICVGAGGKA